MSEQENEHTTPELAPVIRYCGNCLQNRTRNIKGRCIVCNTDLKQAETFAETVSILADLTNEFILLESIRQCAKEYFEIIDNSTPSEYEILKNKIDELRHLVNTD